KGAEGKRGKGEGRGGLVGLSSKKWMVASEWIFFSQSHVLRNFLYPFPSAPFLLCPFSHLLTHSPTHSPTHSLTHSRTHLPTHRLDRATDSSDDAGTTSSPRGKPDRSKFFRCAPKARTRWMMRRGSR